jgi:hypothetical protein
MQGQVRIDRRELIILKFKLKRKKEPRDRKNGGREVTEKSSPKIVSL